MNHANQLNLYINFVLNAVLGKMGEADAMLRAAGHPIKRVASFLRDTVPFESKPIYRGMLLDPGKPFELDPRLTFMSWSEDRDVAAWFANPHTFISQPLGEVHDATLRGYVAATAAPLSGVLWHHSWVEVFGGVETLADLALRHPFMGAEGRRQIAWSLATQFEVITVPMPLDLVAAGDLDPAAIEALDQRFSPAWINPCLSG